MIVNINQCASTFDETLHALKYSAVAKQVGQYWIKIINNFTFEVQTLSSVMIAQRVFDTDVDVLSSNSLLYSVDYHIYICCLFMIHI